MAGLDLTPQADGSVDSAVSQEGAIKMPGFPESKLGKAILAAVLMAGTSGAASAAAFQSVGAGKAQVRAEPSDKAPVRFVLGQGYPVKVGDRQGEWAQVTDNEGEGGWVATASLADRRTVMATEELATVRDGPSSGSSGAFRVRRSVILEYLGSRNGWIHVRHTDGDTGWIRANKVWGD